MKHRSGVLIFIIVVALMVGMLIFAFSGANFQRTLKSWKSNYTGGLYRIVSVYDYNGTRIVIHNAIVIVEEVNK